MYIYISTRYLSLSTNHFCASWPDIRNSPWPGSMRFSVLRPFAGREECEDCSSEVILSALVRQKAWLISSWNPLQPTIQKWMEVWWFPIISYVKIGKSSSSNWKKNHPIDSSQPFISMVGWLQGVPGFSLWDFIMGRHYTNECPLKINGMFRFVFPIELLTLFKRDMRLFSGE